MAEGVGIPLEDHLGGYVEHKRQASQPADHPPDEAVIDDRLMEGGRLVRWGGVLRSGGLFNGISYALSVVFYGVSIIDPRILEEAFGRLDQAGRGESSIGQDERRGSR